MEGVTLRAMTKEDYEGAYKLWETIHGFGLLSVDDKEERIHAFIDRNPGLSVVAVKGCFYHVCVREDLRRQGIGKAMSVACMRALKDEGINCVSLNSFKRNNLGNSFWSGEGYKLRDDYNMYDFLLNEENITQFNS